MENHVLRGTYFPIIIYSSLFHKTASVNYLYECAEDIFEDIFFLIVKSQFLVKSSYMCLLVNTVILLSSSLDTQQGHILAQTCFHSSS